MKKTTVTAALLGLSLFAGAAFADCASQAADKKLAGAAKASFIKKCEKTAGPDACDTSAADKKLAGAAKNSFLKKCKADAAASAAK